MYRTTLHAYACNNMHAKTSGEGMDGSLNSSQSSTAWRVYNNVDYASNLQDSQNLRNSLQHAGLP